MFCLLMLRHPPRSTRPCTLVPSPPLCRSFHRCCSEAAAGGISAILQCEISHLDSACMMVNHRAHKIGVGITREGYVHIAMHLGICGPVGPRSGRLDRKSTRLNSSH